MDSSGVDPSLVTSMSSTLSHRGPDGAGDWISERAGFGHRLLAILDRSDLNSQPMLDDSGRYVLVYNGEIFNFEELRGELTKEGHSFRTRGDTEVVLRALISWGAGALSRFNGMFALAFWDDLERKLILGRDRYGIKPLYFSKFQNSIVFASEQRAILSIPSYKHSLDVDAVFQYLMFQNIFSDSTLANGISILKPGHFLEISVENFGYSTPTKYWDFDFAQDPIGQNREELTEEFRRLFRESVRSQLVADSEVGSYLSGGIDSGLISSFATEQQGALKTFSCGFNRFDGQQIPDDELELAARVSRFLGSDGFEVRVGPADLMSGLTSVARIVEEPRLGVNIQNHKVAELASRHLRIVLSGGGGDELFAGYPWRYEPALTASGPAQFTSLMYRRLLRNGTQDLIKDLLKPQWKQLAVTDYRDYPDSILRDANHTGDSFDDRVNLSLYLDAKTFLHGLLVLEDKIAMSHSLETRFPFLDNNVVDFALRCPVSSKLLFHKESKASLPGLSRNHGQKVIGLKAGKVIVREASIGFLPSEISTAPKSGFSMRGNQWFGAWNELGVRSQLLSTRGPVGDLLDRKKLAQVVDEHFSGSTSHTSLIWSVLTLQKSIESSLSAAKA